MLAEGIAWMCGSNMMSDSGLYLLDDVEKLLKVGEQTNTLKCSILDHYVLYKCFSDLK